MSKLYVFGCSHTESYKTVDLTPLYKEYYAWRGNNFPKVWSEILGELLGFEVVNYGWASSTNQEIMSKVCQHINEPSKDDIVIIQWSYASRFKWIDQKTNKWKKMGANYQVVEDIIHPQTYMDVINYFTHPLYCDFIYDFEKLIETFSNKVGFKVFFWSTECNIIHNLPETIKNQKKYLIPSHVDKKKELGGVFDYIISRGGEFIYHETKDEVHDIHLGEKGHMVQAELFYNHINNLKLI